MNSIYKFILLSLFGFSVSAETRIDIKTDVIKGNSELPKVLYFIPWKSSVTSTSFKGIELENYYEKLIVPYKPHQIEKITK